MTRPIVDLTNQRFGRLVVLGISPDRARWGHAQWVCRCECGNTKAISGSDLRTGRTTSCGCYRREMVAQRNTTHGHSDTPECKSWYHIRNRCLNPKSTDFSRYGGRGITVCAEWASFERFISDMGPRPSARHSIHRIDNDGPYAPWNCVWATPTEQARNKRTSALITYQGRMLSLAAWSEEIGLASNTILMQLRRGWSVEQALSTTPAPLAKPLDRAYDLVSLTTLRGRRHRGSGFDWDSISIPLSNFIASCLA